MQTLVTEFDPDNNIIRIRPPNSQGGITFDVKSGSLSIFNDDDLGVTVDDSGLTAIHRLAINGDITVETGVGKGLFGVDTISPWIGTSSGKRFRLVVDDNGNLQQPLPEIPENP